jgi:UDP-N-acetylmuramoylalanine--D-glutamate ligase
MTPAEAAGANARRPSAGGAFAGERAVVVGFGASGRAAARVLRDEGAMVLVTEAKPLAGMAADAERTEEIAALHLDVRWGGHRPEHLDGATLLVVSPGVPERAPVIGWARTRSIPVWSELEVGARLCRVPIVAVTGTNGKTTTVEMVAAAMRAAGMDARACGNVGYPFSLAAREPADALAVEASSFQLRFHETLHPNVSILLNVAPDHLDWHGSFAAYAAAKQRIFANQTGTDVHVGNRDDAEAARISRRAACDVRWFGWGEPPRRGVGVVDGHVVGAAGETGSAPIDLGAVLATAPGSFAMDAAAAAAAGLAFGLPAEAVRAAVSSARPLAHRGSVVATVGSVAFVDDSKATNPHAALASLEGVRDAVLIAGGLAKGVDLSPLAAAAPALSGVVAIGEAAPVIAAVFDGLVPVRRAASMEEAVGEALEMAPAGGTVILAPACASQDMFRDYRERGDRFSAAARVLQGHVAPTAVPDRQGRGHA